MHISNLCYLNVNACLKVHHQQALDKAQIEIDQGKSPEMKAMAKKIVSAQKKEIAEFDNWFQNKSNRIYLLS